MKKALEILKDIVENSNEDKYEDMTEEELKAHVYEAISEIEEAMKPKTCEGCKQSWEPNNQTFHRYFCEYLKIPVHGDFCCNRYEQKDNALHEKNTHNIGKTMTIGN